MRRTFVKVALVAALIVILSLGLASVAFAVSGAGHSHNGAGDHSNPGWNQASGQGSDQQSAAALAVRNIAPRRGPATGGTRVIVKGSGFQDVQGVSFGTVAASSYEALNSRVIVAVSPAGTAGQTVDVTVTTSAGTSATGQFDQFTYGAIPAPVVQHVAPKAGPATGGTKVIIKGRGFLGVTAVTFGTQAATSFKVLNRRVIAAVAPAGTAGQWVDVTVTSPAGTSGITGADHYTYTDKSRSALQPLAVRGIVPRTGPPEGGNWVVILGSGFTGVTGVSFGTTAASAHVVLSSRVILATAPAGTDGLAVDVTVSTSTATSATGSFDLYTYKAK